MISGPHKRPALEVAPRKAEKQQFHVILVGSTALGLSVSATVTHNWAGKRVKLKLLSYSVRFATQNATWPMRLDIGHDGSFQSSTSSSIVDLNGSGGTVVGGTPYYGSQTCMFFPGQSMTGVMGCAFGQPVWEGVLLAPTLRLEIQDSYNPPGTVNASSASASNQFGYMLLAWEIEEIVD